MKNDEKIKRLIEKGWQFRDFKNFQLRENQEEGQTKKLIIEGVACTFDQETVLFEWEGTEYKEKIDKKAFDDADTHDVIFNYNHDGRVYARTRNDSLHLEVKEDGLHMIATLNPEDEGHMQLYRDIKSGLIDKMSFAFTVSESAYDSDIHLRTIMKIKKLYDVSAVDFPAYDTTSISARSILDLEKSEREKLESETLRKKKFEQRKRKGLALELQCKMMSLKEGGMRK